MKRAGVSKASAAGVVRLGFFCIEWVLSAFLVRVKKTKTRNSSWNCHFSTYVFEDEWEQGSDMEPAVVEAWSVGSELLPVQ